MFSALAIFGVKITRESLTRGIAIADAVALQHMDEIPANVIAAWKELRSALLTWKEKLP